MLPFFCGYFVSRHRFETQPWKLFCRKISYDYEHLRFFCPLTILNVRILKRDTKFRHTMEKVIRAATISNNAATTKEFHYLMRYLAPAASRNPAIFKGKTLFRIRMICALLPSGYVINCTDPDPNPTLFFSVGDPDPDRPGSGFVLGMRIRIQEHVNWP